MMPKSSELFDRAAHPTRGLLGSVVEEQKQSDENETVLELLREQHLDSQTPIKID